MPANAATYFEPPKPPDSSGEWLTLRELAKRWGLSKAAVRCYIDDPIRPMPFTRNDDGIIFVRAADAERYRAENPDRGNAGRRSVSRMPVEYDAPLGKYLTLSEAANAVGYSLSAVRNWIRHDKKPLKVYHNDVGYNLVYAPDLTSYVEHLGDYPEAPEPEECSGAPPPEESPYYPELAAISGIYVTVPQASKATGLSERTIRKWIHRQDERLPTIRNGKQALINKYRLIEFLHREEQVA